MAVVIGRDSGRRRGHLIALLPVLVAGRGVPAAVAQEAAELVAARRTAGGTGLVAADRVVEVRRAGNEVSYVVAAS